MRRRPGGAALIVPCLLVGLLAGPAIAAKDGKERQDRTESIGQKIERERRNLEKIKEEIQEKKRRAQEAEKKKETIMQTLQDLDDRLQVAHQERLDIARKLQQKDQDLQKINAEVLARRADIGQRRESIRARLRAQYLEGRFGYVKALLSAEDYQSLQRRFQYLSAVSKREYDLMEVYREDMAELQEIERQRADARNAILGYKQNTERKMVEIQALKRQKKIVLARIIEQKESYERAAGELERSAGRVDSLLKDLEERRRAAAITRPSTKKEQHATLRPFKGILQWPADGEIVSFFGRQKHPNFQTYVQRKGIEIRTVDGSPIRAVMSGTVAYADWLKGYGLVMILDHGNGFFSLYAHASRLLSRVGDTVKAGYVIGETGDTGLAGESTLYFELRQGAEPVDPLLWLTKKG
jgi:septal ring factor EnvC (AmiA/AmiB activator)